jgi:hypothetical protein
MQFRHAEGEIESHGGIDRERLQGDRAVGATDENVGAEPGSDGDLTARAEIVASKKSGSRRRDAVREYGLHHDAAAGPGGSGAKLQATDFCEPMMKLMPAEMSQVRTSARTRCAAAGSADATVSASAAAPTA